MLARTGDEIVDLVRHGQGVLNIVPLGPVVDELDAEHPRPRRRADGRRAADRARQRRAPAAEGG